MKLKINNRNEDPLWKKISCKCHTSDIELKYPLIECVHCNCKRADDSIPTESFKINQPVFNKQGKFIENKVVEVKEITLTNCDKYGSCIGWGF
jgi:hypothetical protein|tara:strand:+ start:63 stop:341 length:279 start_codon:yes stop_codon:yes gene_type:complete